MSHNVTIKNVKHAAFASHETACFDATVYIDGKKAGTVSNDGQGAPDIFEPHSLRDTLDAIASKLPPVEVFGHEMQCNSELLIADLLDAELNRRTLKRQCSTKTLFRKPGEAYSEGEYHTLKAKYSPAVKAFLTGKYGSDVVILNGTL